MKRAFLAAAAAAFLFHFADDRLGAQPLDDLKFFKNYFVTGDYVAAGVGLRGRGGLDGVPGVAVGNINVQGVPVGAEIVSAQLYWQVVSDAGALAGNVGAKFKGYPLETPDNPLTTGFDPEPYAKVMTFAGSAPCFNPGGGTGNPGNRLTFSYRLDVLRFFDIDTVETSPTFGHTIVNGLHEVQIPDSGPNGQQPPMAAGASLLIVFRYPEGHPQANVLSSIVVYDDGLSLNNSQPAFTQPMAGFYQPAAVPDARITYIIGSGQPDKGDLIVLPGANGTVINPVVGGTLANPGWDTLTYPLPNSLGLTQTGTPPQVFVTTTVSTASTTPGGNDCITPAAIVFKTAVQDTDGDGNLDAWETATSQTPQTTDPRGRQLPPLGAMGASVIRKDVFVEIGYMDVTAQVDGPDEDSTPDSVPYGGVLRPPHSHRPKLEALKLVGKAFNDAPVLNSNGQLAGIAVHFDVGPGYFDATCNASDVNCANHYIIGQRTGESATLARGGEIVDEMTTICQRAPQDPPWVCQYSPYTGIPDSGFPGTVGWKTGFRFIKDKVFSVTPPQGAPAPTPPLDNYCDLPGYACNRRFDEVRKDMFRYAFFAHHLGLAQENEPFDPPNSTTVNPEFLKPVTNTGVGDFPGGDVLVTLGAFLDNDNITPIATAFVQGSTLMHELGHTFKLRHGGAPDEPNCKPTYLSVMNYEYQVRGLLTNAGVPNLGFASQQTQPWTGLDENNLTDGSHGVFPYRLGWYAPLIGSYLDPAPGPNQAAERIAKAAKRHCNGTPKAPNVLMVRVDAFRAETTAPWGIDWNANNVQNLPAADQDLELRRRRQRPS